MENSLKEQIKIANNIMIDDALAKYSPKSRYDMKNKIQSDLKKLYQIEVLNIMEYDAECWEELFEDIESRDISKDNKKRYRWYMKEVIMKALKPEISKGIVDRLNFFTYIFGDHFFEFSEGGFSYEFFHIKPDEIRMFLSELYTANIDHYIWFGIICFSGCRAAGLLNLKVQNIKFIGQYFITQEKKTKDSTGNNRYYLPKRFLEELLVYIRRKNLQHDDNICPLNYQSLQYWIKQYRPTWRIHLLRHAIRVNWHDKGMPDVEAHFLQNHTPANIDQNYMKTINTAENMRDVYNRFFPY